MDSKILLVLLLVGFQIKLVQFGTKLRPQKMQLLAFGEGEENKHKQLGDRFEVVPAEEQCLLVNCIELMSFELSISVLQSQGL
nr:MAG TPA: hypothetical protein [Caudoviricetes sp.]